MAKSTKTNPNPVIQLPGLLPDPLVFYSFLLVKRSDNTSIGHKTINLKCYKIRFSYVFPEISNEDISVVKGINSNVIRLQGNNDHSYFPECQKVFLDANLTVQSKTCFIIQYVKVSGSNTRTLMFSCSQLHLYAKNISMLLP